MPSLAILLALVIVPGCRNSPEPPKPACTAKLVAVALPADWATFPVVARIGAPTVRKHWEGIDIETTKRALGPFVVVITRHDNQSTAGWAIQQPDCSEEGVNPGRDDMAFYMLGTAALRQKDDVFVLTVIGPKSENAVAFTKR